MNMSEILLERCDRTIENVDPACVLRLSNPIGLARIRNGSSWGDIDAIDSGPSVSTSPPAIEPRNGRDGGLTFRRCCRATISPKTASILTSKRSIAMATGSPSGCRATRVRLGAVVRPLERKKALYISVLMDFSPSAACLWTGLERRYSDRQ